MDKRDEESLENAIQRMVDGFEKWLRERIKGRKTRTPTQGYEFRLKDTKHQVVFAYRRNDDSYWWDDLIRQKRVEEIEE